MAPKKVSILDLLSRLDDNDAKALFEESRKNRSSAKFRDLFVTVDDDDDDDDGGDEKPKRSFFER